MMEEQLSNLLLSNGKEHLGDSARISPLFQRRKKAKKILEQYKGK